MQELGDRVTVKRKCKRAEAWLFTRLSSSVPLIAGLCIVKFSIPCTDTRLETNQPPLRSRNALHERRFAATMQDIDGLIAEEEFIQ